MGGRFPELRPSGNVTAGPVSDNDTMNGEKKKKKKKKPFRRLLPVVEPDQDGPVELVLRAVGLRPARVDERVNGGQHEALLVELLQLAGQLAHRREAQRGRPA